MCLDTQASGKGNEGGAGSGYLAFSVYRRRTWGLYHTVYMEGRRLHCTAFGYLGCIRYG
jgi:hypothetical protein